MEPQRTLVGPECRDERIECLRDKQGRLIGQVAEARAVRIVGRGAETVLLVRPHPRRDQP